MLDEPFEAVDPVSAALIRDILQRYVAGGGTVVFSSHVMEVVERLCSHVAILADGMIRLRGTLDEVRGEPVAGGRLRAGRRRPDRDRVGAGVAVSVPVRTFVRLKLRLTANGLRGQTWRVALFVLGRAGRRPGGRRLRDVRRARPARRASGRPRSCCRWAAPVIVLGWLFLPLVFFGVDESLDPARFALLPLRRRTLIGGLFVGVAGRRPGGGHLAAPRSAWSTRRPGSAGRGAALAQLVGVVPALLLCAALSRAVTSAFATALRSRRARDLATVLLALVAALLGPLQTGRAGRCQNADWDRVARWPGWSAGRRSARRTRSGLDVAAGRALGRTGEAR